MASWKLRHFRLFTHVVNFLIRLDFTWYVHIIHYTQYNRPCESSNKLQYKYNSTLYSDIKILLQHCDYRNFVKFVH